MADLCFVIQSHSSHLCYAFHSHLCPAVTCWRQQPSAAGPYRKCLIKHNGQDDSAAILDAFEKCKDGGRVVFSKGKNYVLGDVIVTPELNNVEIIFEGNLKYPFNMQV